jgi:hypothetical protein
MSAENFWPHVGIRLPFILLARAGFQISASSSKAEKIT